MGTVFASLYQSEGLADVTLCCEDGAVRAHKLLLSTCSDYFLELFLEVTSKRAMVVVPGVKLVDLKGLLSFIYTGEVNVTQDGLTGLLEVAEMLGVRGLKAGDEPKTPDIIKSAKKDNEEPKSPVKKVEAEKRKLEETEAESQEESFKAEAKRNRQESVSPPPDISITPVANIKMEPSTALVPVDTNEGDVEEEAEYEGDESFDDDMSSIAIKHEPIDQGGSVEAYKRQQQQQFQQGQQHLQQSQLEQALRQPLDPYAGYQAAASRHASLQQTNPLASMTSLAAMYRNQEQVTDRTVAIPGADRSRIGPGLDHYRMTSQEGKLPMDLLPEDVNNIMAQSTQPYCPLCNKDCGNFPNLRSHLQVHNSIRPYQCNYCDSKFARVSHLNRHIRTHTGERPFACERCGKSFARQDKLKLHMDRHIARENKSEVMNQLLAAASRNQPPTLALKKSPAKDKTSPAKNLLESLSPAQPSSSVTPMSAAQSHINSLNTAATNFAGNGSLWGAFPMYNDVASYQPMYQSMVGQQYMAGHPAMHNVMKIGECSIKPLGQ